MRNLLLALSALLLAGCSAGSGALPPGTPGQAQAARDTRGASATFRTLYTFQPDGDGKSPQAGLVELRGKFYGTTWDGGANGLGSVFEVNADGKERVVYSFKGGPDGANPQANLAVLGNVLYGTTTAGGVGSGNGNGTVFSVTPEGSETVLHAFAGSNDGAAPHAGLVALDGILYGTTFQGGAHRAGTVFSIAPSGNENVIYAFAYSPDGAYPLAGLTLVNGEFYGTTAGGGAGRGPYGTVFQISPGGSEKVIYSFKGHADGETPAAPLAYLNGDFYGTTAYGGTKDPSLSFGTVFKVSPDGKEKVIHAFTGEADGAEPQGGLTPLNGILYGTTYFGGDTTPSTHGDGVVFAMDVKGNETVLHTFLDGSDGANPICTLIVSGTSLFGTTSDFGLSAPSGNGSVFELTP